MEHQKVLQYNFKKNEQDINIYEAPAYYAAIKI